MKTTIFLTYFTLMLCTPFYSQNKKIAMKRKENDVIVVMYLTTGKDNVKTANYTLKNKEEKVLLKDIRGMENLGHGYQAIDAKNKLIYFSLEKGNIVFKSGVKDVIRTYTVCGTAPSYNVTIKDTLNHFEIILFTDNMWLNKENTMSSIGQISKNDADDCYFINGKREYSYENYPATNSFSGIKNENPNAVIFRKNNLYGIFSKTEAVYDEIKIEDLMTKVKKDKLYGYYEINKVPKYKRLDNFIGLYARFELPNGKKGYLTGSGYEYFDK